MSHENTVTDCWEDIDETELEKRLDQEKQERIRKDQEMATTRQNGLSILSHDSDDFRPKVLQRPKVTILKRPDSSSALSSASSQYASKPQIKTLEQREKEYAEARLRILGSAVSDESPMEPSKPFINNKVSPSSSSSSFLTNNIQNQQQKSPENVVRLPKGPAAGQGFNIRR